MDVYFKGRLFTDKILDSMRSLSNRYTRISRMVFVDVKRKKMYLLLGALISEPTVSYIDSMQPLQYTRTKFKIYYNYQLINSFLFYFRKLFFSPS